ncbi:TlyA family RNA methyltransferase [Bifidobacterium eulemuris]|uniref:Cell division protein FtsJ n=1 Tax=Bifidobacterium eulemuris TaxID=1765219 RepID=A0A261GBV5_9BIFI|nr:TlyA family RNA methyltransferase [Bifidobacterium eulemuris]OZG68921.1 cell division protein FtsJ [Bifidobacterium eulemuris]QOL31541.1 TlyA family RNA methyltransferase [Bifidobacterium eulemuris]
MTNGVDPIAGGSAAQEPRRLDVLLVERGLVASRSKAQRLIKDGAVLIDGAPAGKPSSLIAPSAVITVDKGDDYVSRGAYKLVGAFDRFGEDGLPSPKGLLCLDIGASTGGFTQVLLRGGAERVIALDVGHGQLDPRIASDTRVIEMSGVNIRDVEADSLPFRPQMVVSDVSFISLTHVMPVIARIARRHAHIVLLVKPQFEMETRSSLGKNGVVDDPAARRAALDRVTRRAQEVGLRVVSWTDSPIEGTHGNHEYLLYAVLDDGLPTLEPMASADQQKRG